ncbi:MAG: DUF4249 family protein [Candidatus Kapabacteria bacterium]|nr:DUF4249 family protein [Candidatus Kapabacteria bacterium]
MKKHISYLHKLIVTILAGSTIISCGDAVITDDYVQQNVISSLLMVGDTIKGIQVFSSQPLNKPYSIRESMITNAEVSLTDSATANRIPLTYRTTDTTGAGEYYSAQGVLVQPKTTYLLQVKFADGSVATGRTVTPDSLSWVRPPKPVAQFPTDTLNLPSVDSLKIEWKLKSGLQSEYLLAVRCFDTLNYGSLRTPPTTELNARTPTLINRFGGEGNPEYFEKTSWGFLVNTQVPVVWNAFKWYGSHEIVIYAPDKNMAEWFKLNQFQGAEKRYDPNQGSINGNAVGVCGSASLVRGPMFVVKNPK